MSRFRQSSSCSVDRSVKDEMGAAAPGGQTPDPLLWPPGRQGNLEVVDGDRMSARFRPSDGGKAPMVEGGRRLGGYRPATSPDRPLISVITVVFNAVATIETALRSVASQRYPHVEHIVIDGGSTDGTVDVLRRYDGQIDYWLSEPDRGIYDAMNKGIRAASGTIIGTLNADDRYADEECLDAVADAFRAHSPDCVHGNLNIVRSIDGRPVRRYHMAGFRNWMLRIGIMPAHPTWYCKRAMFERVGLYDPTYRIAGDFELVLRALWKHRCTVHYIDRLLVLMSDGGLSNQGLISKLALNREIVRACRANGVYTNLSLVAAKLPFKFVQYLPR
jgi:glycosyltransferase involved in cell wall biosynthesis